MYNVFNSNHAHTVPFTSPYDESERSLYHLVDRDMNSVIRKVMEA